MVVSSHKLTTQMACIFMYARLSVITPRQIVQEVEEPYVVDPLACRGIGGVALGSYLASMDFSVRMYTENTEVVSVAKD